MSRIAVWKRGPYDPDSSSGWLFGGSLPERPGGPSRRKVRAKRLALAVALFGIATALETRFGGRIHVSLWVLVIGANLLSQKKSTALVKSEPTDAVWVHIALLDRTERRTGSDAGWLIHCDGWLLFEGGRTSFSLSREAMRRLRYQDPARLQREDDRAITLAPGKEPDTEPLGKLLKAWSEAPIPEGESILPPTVVHRGEIAQAENRWIVSALVCLVLGVLCAVVELWAVVGVMAVAAAACLVPMARGLAEAQAQLRRAGLLPPKTAAWALGNGSSKGDGLL